MILFCFIYSPIAEAYSGPCQTSMTEHSEAATGDVL